MDHEPLIGILREARGLLSRPGNDFRRSGWDGQSQALAEVDNILRRLAAREKIDPISIKVLFAPTGPIQEVSIPSGWSDEFMNLARRFDKAMGDP